jgi:hypothetical protein
LLLAVTVPVVSFPVTSSAEKPDKPTTQPARPFGRFEGPMGKIGPGRQGQFNGPIKYTPEEFDTAREFAQKNFPSFYDMFTQLPEKGPMRNALAQRMVGRYRNMMRMQDQNPELYTTMLDQAKLEDKAIGYAREMRNAKTDAAKADAKAKLDNTVAQIIDQSLTERQQRIEKLRSLLDDQEKKLKEDQDNKDQLIAQQINHTQQEFDRMLRGNLRGPGADGGAPAPDNVNALQQ